MTTMAGDHCTLKKKKGPGKAKNHPKPLLGMADNLGFTVALPQ